MCCAPHAKHAHALGSVQSKIKAGKEREETTTTTMALATTKGECQPPWLQMPPGEKGLAEATNPSPSTLPSSRNDWSVNRWHKHVLALHLVEKACKQRRACSRRANGGQACMHPQPTTQATRRPLTKNNRGST